MSALRQQKHALQTRPTIYQTVSLGNLVNRGTGTPLEVQAFCKGEVSEMRRSFSGVIITSSGNLRKEKTNG